MYNGIGLSTPRGSGTSGHVQRNLACSRKSKDKVSPQNNEVVAPAYKKSNVDIDEHNRKRQIELKCLEFQSMLEDKGLVNPVIIEGFIIYYSYYELIQGYMNSLF